MPNIAGRSVICLLVKLWRRFGSAGLECGVTAVLCLTWGWEDSHLAVLSIKHGELAVELDPVVPRYNALAGHGRYGLIKTEARGVRECGSAQPREQKVVARG